MKFKNIIKRYISLVYFCDSVTSPSDIPLIRQRELKDILKSIILSVDSKILSINKH